VASKEWVAAYEANFRLTRRQEIDRSIDRGTVPARYRSQVAREHQQYIPFDKQ
jgi:hypothetical protein